MLIHDAFTKSPKRMAKIRYQCTPAQIRAELEKFEDRLDRARTSCTIRSFGGIAYVTSVALIHI